MDDDTSRNVLVPRLHPQSIMGRSPQNEGLYSNLYDKDMSLMRKLMNLDEFQCSSNGNGSNIMTPNSEMNASKQFDSYTSGGEALFNRKFTATNFASSLAYDSKQLHPNGLNRNNHEGILKPCYDNFSNATTATSTKSETIDDTFGSNPTTGSIISNNNVGYKKQSSTIQATSTSLFQSSSASLSGGVGFIHQFSHESLFGTQNQQTFTKLNQINNNSNVNSNILVKLENGGNISTGLHANDFIKLSNDQHQNVCSQSSTTVTASNKIEPNEFRNVNNANNIINNSISHIKDDNIHIENERKNPNDDSSDGFTQL